ncbi:hypothetical protein EC973_002567 [Apophysomyces ossiformis]|uniref:Uncharacterized protein n=1 Tax=Apophysomyces ossiformis TaxID=679940 RepID=A0A8H7BSC1_9FUNG|nr:hypothetical protein EC973_002567 [Apophysomyces ossiformis]
MPSLLLRAFTPFISHKYPTPTARDADLQQVVLLPIAKPDISIWRAAEKGDVNAIQYYIEQSSDPASLLNTRDPNTECTLLHLVVSNNRDPLPLMQLLLEHGADATARNVYNVQAIHTVSLHSSEPLACIQLLLDYDADPNACDGDGWTPLHYAARFCRAPEPVLQLLVQSGADINARDTNAKTAIFGLLANGDHHTTLDWCIHVVKANVAVKGDFLDQQTRRTRQGTIVMQAAKYGRLECLKVLSKSSVAMAALRTVLTRDELDYCITFIERLRRQEIEKEKEEEPVDLVDIPQEKAKRTKLEEMLVILQDIIQLLEKQPTQTEGQLSRRRTSLLLRASIRKRKQLPLPPTISEETDSEDGNLGLLKRMSHLFSRHKPKTQEIV